MPVKKSLIPTRKWFVTAAVLLSGVGVSAIDSGWDDVESKMLIGVGVTLVSAWAYPNRKTPSGDGVPSEIVADPLDEVLDDERRPIGAPFDVSGGALPDTSKVNDPDPAEP